MSPHPNERIDNYELSLEMMEPVSGGFNWTGISVGTAKLPTSNPRRQPVDPSPSLGTSYSGDSVGGAPAGGGYLGDPDYHDIREP
jgi:hypothetical protein